MSPAPAASPPTIHHISTCLVKPPPQQSADEQRRCELTPWDIAMFSTNYIQWGLLFSKLPPPPHRIADRLKTSLSAALRHFPPLAGRFVTAHEYGDTNQSCGMSVSIDCGRGGAEFVHAVADELTAADVLAPFGDVPSFVRSLFPHDRAVNYDGHSLPLLAVQVTELADGVFIGCSFNHAVGDGTSFWNFFKAWADICRTSPAGGGGGEVIISNPPIHKRWYLGGVSPPIKLPFSHPDEFIERYAPPSLRERVFHFTAQSTNRMKARANGECGTDAISSFQALCSLVWRSVTRARRIPPDQKTLFRMAAGSRRRMRPPLSTDYFGNSVIPLSATATAGELLAHGLGWGAWLVHESVAAVDDGAIRGALRDWSEAPFVYRPSGFDRSSVMVGGSARFDAYGCDFGWGEAAAVRSGSGNKFDGKVMTYRGRGGGGSVDLEVCLAPEVMSALEADAEFASEVSPPVDALRNGTY